jgi:hypothetical protein
MKTSSRLLALAPIALAACVETKVPIEMFGICALPEPDACSFEATCDGFYLGPNVIDISTAERLWLIVEVHNQLLSNEDPDLGRANTHNAYIQDVRMTFSGLDLPATRHDIQQVVPADGTSVISIYPITEETVTALGAAGIVGVVDIIANVRLVGVLGDSSEFETEVYEIPVRVCDGCIPIDTCPAGTFLGTCPPDPITLQPIQGQFPRTAACFTP